MNKVIVTGATSFIGVHLVQELLKHGYEVTAVVRPASENLKRLPPGEKLTVLELDMADIAYLPQRVGNAQFDVFYHLAWEGVRAPYRDDEYMQLENYKNAIAAMEVAKQLHCRTFVGSGSQAEYGKCIGRITESYPPNPVTQYGKYKLLACNTLAELADACGMKFIWTRIFSVYGVHDYGQTLIMSALKKMAANEEIQLTECIQNWDYIHVSDAARAMFLLGNTECQAGIYNIASGNTRQLKEYVLDMKRILKSDSQLNFGAIEYGAEGIVSFEPVIDKLKNNLNWSCEVSFEEGIKELSQNL